MEENQLLLHYRIVKKLGQGGMGEVFLAADTKLERPVALKMLPEEVRRDLDRMARFKTEAKAAAQLNHPNIATIYAVEETEDLLFISMEFVDGQPLNALIPPQGVTLETFFAWFFPFTDAFCHAYERGITHLDIKPKNLMISKEGVAKVLDFGLAMITRPDQAGPDSEGSTKSLETILGTVAYMSPEQAAGKKVSGQTDIFSLGIVMYEALAGRRPFVGETTFLIATSILRDEPAPVTAIRPDIPQHLGRIVRKCLQKDTRKRYQTIREVFIDLNEVRDIVSRHAQVAEAIGASSVAVAEPVPAPAPVEARPAILRRWLVTIAAAVVVFALGLLTAWLALDRAAPPTGLPLRKAQFSAGTEPVISPDGTMVAYIQGGRLWIRDFSQLDPRAIPETDGAAQPFWSPQSDFVGYFDRDKATLKKVSAKGGPSTVLCKLSVPLIEGATWGSAGTIVFSPTGQSNAGLFEVPAQGGETKRLIAPDTSQGETGFRQPRFLPDGRTLLFIIIKNDGSGEIVVQSGSTRTRLFSSSDEVINFSTYSPTGHVLFQRGALSSGVWAIPFSLSSLNKTGEPSLVAHNASSPSVSTDGTLVYRSTTADGSQLVWVDRTGKVLGTIGQPQETIEWPALSPDGRRVAVAGAEQGNTDIWIHDIARGIKTRLTSDPALDVLPVWSPAGDQIAFTSFRSGAGDIFVQATDGSGTTRPLVTGPLGEYAPTWSRDGQYLAYHVFDPKTNRDLWVLPITGGKKSRPFLKTAFHEPLPVISPDGRYIAYESNESGRWEVCVRPFPKGVGKWQVSVNGGVYPRWNGRGDELFYVEDNTLMAVRLDTRSGFKEELPQKLFTGDQVGMRLYDGSIPANPMYDVAADGQRFVVVRPVGNGAPSMMTVVQNWVAEFKKQ